MAVEALNETMETTELLEHHFLVGGFNHVEKYESQWEGWHPIYYGK